jgi:hypothetical protein
VARWRVARSSGRSRRCRTCRCRSRRGEDPRRVASEPVVNGSALNLIVAGSACKEVPGRVADQGVSAKRPLRVLDRANGVRTVPSSPVRLMKTGSTSEPALIASISSRQERCRLRLRAAPQRRTMDARGRRDRRRATIAECSAEPPARTPEPPVDEPKIMMCPTCKWRSTTERLDRRRPRSCRVGQAAHEKGVARVT